MKLSTLVQWLETTHALHSQNQMKNSYSQVQNQVISAHSKLRTRCLCSVNQSVPKVLKILKLLQTIRSVSVEVMDKLSSSMSTKTSVNL